MTQHQPSAWAREVSGRRPNCESSICLLSYACPRRGAPQASPPLAAAELAARSVRAGRMHLCQRAIITGCACTYTGCA